MLILIRGAGDLASGIALRLFRSGFSVVMTDLPHPTSIRRTVSFSEAIVKGENSPDDAPHAYRELVIFEWQSLGFARILLPKNN